MSLQIVLILLLATIVIGLAVLVAGSHWIGLAMIVVPIFLFVVGVFGAKL